MSADPEILVVEDDPSVARGLSTALKAAGYTARLASTGRQAIELAALRPISAVLLDLGLPDLDGLAVLGALREVRPATPIIVVSAAGEVATKIDALDAGACDYVTKPYDVSELLARLRVAARTANSRADPIPSVVMVGDVELDLEKRRVSRDGSLIHMTPTEYRLLALLASRPGRSFAKEEILTSVWGPGYKDEFAYLHTYIARLRRKIEPGERVQSSLVSDRGHGYRLELRLR